jgi:hypothetical protein
MANVIKDITVNWSWSGDTYAIDGFNVAITPSTDNPKTSVAVMSYAAGNVTTYKFRDVTLDNTLTYTAWVQAIYDGGDSDWVSAGNLTVTDDGTATIATKNQVDAINSTLADIANDNKLTPVEKQDILQQWNIIAGEKANIDSQASLYSISTEKTTYDNAYDALAKYLNGNVTLTDGTTPLWLGTDATNGLNATTTIDGPTFRSNFTAYFNARTALLTIINTAAKTYVDSIQIGATNILKNTAFTASYTGWSGSSANTLNDFQGSGSLTLTRTNYASGNPRQQLTYGLSNLPLKKSGNQYSIGAWVYVDSSIALAGGAGQNSLAVRFMKTDNVNFFDLPVLDLTSVPTNTWSYISGVATLSSDISGSGSVLLSLSQNGLVKIARPKLELGNKPSAWTPAPEDTDAAVSAAQTAADAANNLLKDIADDNKLTPSEKQDTLKEWNVISGEKGTLDGQADIFSVTTEKSAYDTAFTNLAYYLNGNVTWTVGAPLWLGTDATKGLNTTTTIDGPTFRSNFATYYNARATLLKAIDNAAKNYTDAVQVGGRNLMRNTDFSAFNSSNFPTWNATTQTAMTTSITLASGEVIPFLTIRSTTGQAQNTVFGLYTAAADSTRFSLVAGQQYTLSFLIAAHANTVNPLNYVYVINDGGTNQSLNSLMTDIKAGVVYGSFTSPFPLTVYRYSVTFTATYSSSTARMLIGSSTSQNFTGGSSYGLFYIARPKLEAGNRATDWSPAPEDTNAAITQVKNDLHLTATLPTTLTMDGYGITATTTSDPTAYARMDYRGLYVRGGALWVDGGLASTDTLNLVYNSTGKIADKNGNALGWQGTLPVENVDGRVALKMTTSGSGEITMPSKPFTVKANTTYSWGIWIKQTTNSKGIDLFFLGQYQGQINSSYTLVRNLKTGAVTTTFTYYYGTFTTDASTVSGYMRIDNNGSSDGAASSAWFSELMVVEGTYDNSTKPMPAWGPSEDDVIFGGQDYNGVKIDGLNGIQVTSAHNTLSLNASDGIKLTKTSDGSTIFSQDSSGNLNLTGNITMLSGSKIQWGTTGNAQTPLDYLNSREQNLVTNGNGQLKDDTNFSGFTFDGTDSPDGTTGSFVYTGMGATLMSDEIIPINTSESYSMSMWVKDASGGSESTVGTAIVGEALVASTGSNQNMYVGLAPYDIDGNAISPLNYMYLAGTKTTLAQDLKPGDTVVYLTDVSGWNNATGTNTYRRRLIFWNHINSLGYIYPPETYSRNYSANDLWADGSINTTNNTITLRAPFGGTTTYSAGTSLSQGDSGSSYVYCLMQNETVPLDWSHKIATISGIQSDGSSAVDTFPAGTAGAKIVFLTNYGGSTSATVRIAGIQLTMGVKNNDFNGLNITNMIVADGDSMSLLSKSINLTGMVNFQSFDPNDTFTDMFQQQPDGSTVIDGSKILTGSIHASDVVFSNLTIQNSTGSNTFVVDTNGNVDIQGSVQSLNYAPKSAGWAINSDGTAEFNGATFRGNIEAGYVSNGVYTANAGIMTSGTSGR